MEKIIQSILAIEIKDEIAKSKFRWNHVDSLLNQSADLLDRCLSDLKELRSLNFAKIKFEFELSQDKFEFQNKKALAEKGYYDWNEQSLDRKKQFLNGEGMIKFQELSAVANKVADVSGKDSPATVNAFQINYEGAEYNFELAATSRAYELAGFESHYNKQVFWNTEKAIANKEDILKSSYFDVQILALESYILRDFEDALVRLTIAQQGLNQIYGREKPLPDKNEEIVTQLSIWVREAIESVIEYQQLDQGFTIIVPLRGLSNEDQWRLLALQPIQLQINSDLLLRHDNIRLKGIGASIVGSAGLVPWAMVLSLPRTALYVRNGREVETQQVDLPACFLGKVENKRSIKGVEYGGTISLVNVSPIGKNDSLDGLWMIELIRPNSGIEAFIDIDDIILELIVVGHPKEVTK